MGAGKHRKRLKAIERLAGVRIEKVEMAGNGHLRLTISGLSRVCFCASSPSDGNSHRQTARDIKRALKGSK